MKTSNSKKNIIHECVRSNDIRRVFFEMIFYRLMYDVCISNWRGDTMTYSPVSKGRKITHTNTQNVQFNISTVWKRMIDYTYKCSMQCNDITIFSLRVFFFTEIPPDVVDKVTLAVLPGYINRQTNTTDHIISTTRTRGSQYWSLCGKAIQYVWHYFYQMLRTEQSLYT